MQINKVNPSFTGIVQVGQRIGDEAIRQTGLIDDICSAFSSQRTNIVKVLGNKLDADIAILPKPDGQNVSLKIIHSTDFGDFFAESKEGKEIETTLNINLSKQSILDKLKAFSKSVKDYIHNPNNDFVAQKTEKFHSEWAEEANKLDDKLAKKLITQKTYNDNFYKINEDREFAKETIYDTDMDF